MQFKEGGLKGFQGVSGSLRELLVAFKIFKNGFRVSEQFLGVSRSSYGFYDVPGGFKSSQGFLGSFRRASWNFQRNFQRFSRVF